MVVCRYINKMYNSYAVTVKGAYVGCSKDLKKAIEMRDEYMAKTGRGTIGEEDDRIKISRYEFYELNAKCDQLEKKTIELVSNTEELVQKMHILKRKLLEKSPELEGWVNKNFGD